MFRIFIKTKYERFKKITKNYFGKNVIPINTVDLYLIRLAFKKHSRKSNSFNYIYIYIYKKILDSVFLKNNTKFFFFLLLFFTKTKKLRGKMLLISGEFYSFSKVIKRRVYSVRENKNYPQKVLNQLWRTWWNRHRSPHIFDKFKSFSAFTKKRYYEKLMFYYANRYFIMDTVTTPKRTILVKPWRYLLKKKNLIKNLVSKNTKLLHPIKYFPASLHKNIDIDTNKYVFQYLRKNKVYNKGRYSRTRQNYRTGVYMCMYVSLISIFGLYFIFFRFSFKFTYMWWFFFFFVTSFFVPKIIQNRLYEPNIFFQKFVSFIHWTSFIFKHVKHYFSKRN